MSRSPAAKRRWHKPRPSFTAPGKAEVWRAVFTPTDAGLNVQTGFSGNDFQGKEKLELAFPKFKATVEASDVDKPAAEQGSGVEINSEDSTFRQGFLEMTSPSSFGRAIPANQRLEI
jgi:hypothetical protein